MSGITKTYIFFTVFCCLPFPLFSQLITLNLKNVTVKEAIEALKEKSEYSFVFESSDLNTKMIISVSSTQKPITEVVKQILDGQDVVFEIKAKNIILSKKAGSNLADNSIRKLTGLIINEKGEPIFGASVFEKETNTGTISDINGRFTLSVTSQAMLIISYIGYLPQRIKPGLLTDLKVQMAENNFHLNEVQVVGYGTQKKESVLGAISAINTISLIKSGSQTITNALAGKLSGVLTMQQSGEPGNNNTEIVVRGVSSWNGSAPLVLVDGIERDFKDMDINEVSSISVLKDASSTAVFGSKGANGVILVSTRQGTISKPRMNLTFSTGFNQEAQIPNFIDSYTTMSLLNVALMNGQQFNQLISQNVLNEYRNPSTPINSLRYPNVDWIKLLANNFAPTTYANFNIQGGSDFAKYFCSIGVYNEGSLFDMYHNGYDDTRFTYNRINYRANIDIALTKSTQLSLKAGGAVKIKNQPSRVTWEALYATSPARFPAYFPAWVLQQIPDPVYPNATGIRQAASFGEFYGNPYSAFNSGSFNQYSSSNLFTDLILNQDLSDIIPGLSLRGKLTLSTYYQDISLTANYEFPQYQLDYSKIGIPGENPWSVFGQVGNNVYTQPLLDINIGGLQQNFYSNLYYEAGLDYSHTFGKQTVTALALVNRQQKNADIRFPYYNEALVGRATYDFAHKYLFEFNVGYTGSEQFSPENRFGFFPSGAIGWVISEEDFFRNAVSWMNKLKIRYSDGFVGSDNSDQRWLYKGDYSVDRNYIVENSAPNSTAQWESSHKRDLGFEIGLFENLISINVDLFDEYRDKMLLKPQTTTMLVGNSFKDMNLGSMKKHGFEVELDYHKKMTKNFSYVLKFQFGYNENRVTYKDDLLYSEEYQKAAGKPLDAQLKGVLLTGTGYFTSVDDIHNNPAPISIDKLNVGDYKFLDYSADGIITTSDEYPIAGSYYAPITYSLSPEIKYKGFEFSFLLLGNVGKYVNYNQNYEAEFNKGNYRLHASQLDYWSPTNLTANHATLHYNESTSAPNLGWGGGESYTGYSLMIENRFWRSADYLRLKDVYASYTFNSDFLKQKIGIAKLSVYATGSNLFTLTPLIEGDPERKDYQSGFYPVTSSMIFGLKFYF